MRSLCSTSLYKAAAQFPPWKFEYMWPVHKLIVFSKSVIELLALPVLPRSVRVSYLRPPIGAPYSKLLILHGPNFLKMRTIRQVCKEKVGLGKGSLDSSA